MKSYLGWHANEEEKVTRSCDQKRYHYSTGNDHWLGNGTYFFEDSPEGNGKLHAESWNYKQSHSNPAAFKADISVNEENLIDLEDEETLMLVNKLKDRYLTRMLQFNKKPKNGYIDGFFYNMWDSCIKRKKIDLIRRQDYYQTKSDQLLQIRSRTPNVYVLCVRNKECISNPKRCY